MSKQIHSQYMEEDVLREECGVMAAYDFDGGDVAGSIYYGLLALQHRGQESCGIAVTDTNAEGNKVLSHRDMGLVNEAFDKGTIEKLSGNLGVGHVRYSTAGSSTRENAQPLVLNYIKGTLALAHNGNLINAPELRRELARTGAIFQTTIDSELIAYHIARERVDASNVEQAVSRAMKKIKGAYSLAIISPRKMIGARDPYGFRPLCIGKRDNTYFLASESCALDTIGAEFIRDVEPGEILVFTKNDIISRKEHCKQKQRKSCIFEYIYFARPDSVIDEVSVHQARIQAGKVLAKTHPVEADVVVGVPDSGLDAALGFSQESGIPYGIGLIKNKYIGRTFISPGQSTRLDQVKIKLSAVEASVKGKRVVLIDDSIVRGTTSGRIVRLLREAGAKEIHMRISAPPFLHPCYYGTDIDSCENLIACKHSVEEIAELIGADSLGYLPVSELSSLTGNEDYCSACFDGNYPTPIPADTRKDRFEQKISAVKKAKEK